MIHSNIAKRRRRCLLVLFVIVYIVFQALSCSYLVISLIILVYGLL